MDMKRNKEIGDSVATSTLLARIFQAPSPHSFLEENTQALAAPTFTEYLDTLCRERNAVREHVISRAGIERSFGHQLFRGARNPSRDNVLRLAFGFMLDVEQTQAFLRAARRAPLYPRIKRDAVIIWGLAHGKTIVDIQVALNDFGLTQLGGEKYEHFEG